MRSVSVEILDDGRVVVADVSGRHEYETAREARAAWSKYLLTTERYRAHSATQKGRDEECLWHDMAEEVLRELGRETAE